MAPIANGIAMAAAPYKPTFHNVDVAVKGLGDFKINYIEAGSPHASTILLLHGFPSSANQYRDLIPLLSGDYHVLAPDMPSYGATTSPKDMKYTFDNLTAVISAWLDTLKINSYAVYIFDYGAPVGLRLALQKPDHVKAIISQNGNAYNEGFGEEFWAPIVKLWKSDNGSEARDWLRENYLSLGTTKFQYHMGVPEQDYPLINPMTWNTDYLFNLAGKENQDRQLDLFYDYRTNKDIYPKFHEYFRKTQVPLLAVWGKGDPCFVYPGAEAFKKDLPDAEIHLLDAGHFALETVRWEIAKLMLEFLGKVQF